MFHPPRIWNQQWTEDRQQGRHHKAAGPQPGRVFSKCLTNYALMQGNSPVNGTVGARSVPRPHIGDTLVCFFEFNSFDNLSVYIRQDGISREEK